jgi:hypothetical protein
MKDEAELEVAWGAWNKKIWSSNKRELEAVWQALHHYQATLNKKQIRTIQIQSDNTTTCSTLAKAKA